MSDSGSLDPLAYILIMGNTFYEPGIKMKTHFINLASGYGDKMETHFMSLALGYGNKMETHFMNLALGYGITQGTMDTFSLFLNILQLYVNQLLISSFFISALVATLGNVNDAIDRILSSNS